jgi:excisionase family DNA binding protein
MTLPAATTPTAADRQQILYDVPSAAAVCSVSVRTMWALIKDGRVPTVKIGRRTLIRRADLEALAA